MKIKSVNDLKALNPELIKKLGLRKINSSDIAKLGLQVFNAGDIAKINTKPFDINDLAQYGLKNFYTTESVEHWLNNFTYKSQPKQNNTQQNDRPANLTTDITDSLANLQQTANKAGISKDAEQCDVIKKRPYRRRGWPFLWGRPAFGRTRNNHNSAGSKQGEQKEKMPQGSDLQGNLLESTPQQNSEIGQKISSMNLPVQENERENVPVDKVDNKISAVNPDELQDEFEGNPGDNFEGSSENIFDHPPRGNEKENKERIFQLESVKEGIEIKRNPYKVMTLKSWALMHNR